MRDAQARWPLQARRDHARKVAKAAGFLLLQQPLLYGLVAWLLARCGRSIGALVRAATRGFPADDAAALLALLRRRPCAPLLALLARRLERFDERRLFRRARAGEALRAIVQTNVPPPGLFPGAARARTGSCRW
jgi:hypothetical protein